MSRYGDSSIGEHSEIDVDLTSVDIGLTLRSALRDSARLRRLSYAHNNGFMKVVLSTGNRRKLVAHIWRPGSSVSALSQHVHNHRWTFTSMLLEGSYVNELFEPSIDGEEYRQYQYSSPGATGSIGLMAVGPASLSCRDTVVVAAGCSYRQDHEVLHRVRPLEAQVVSLLVQSPPVRATADVFVHASVSTPPPSNAGALSEADFAAGCEVVRFAAIRGSGANVC